MRPDDMSNIAVILHTCKGCAGHHRIEANCLSLGPPHADRIVIVRLCSKGFSILVHKATAIGSVIVRWTTACLRTPRLLRTR